MTTEALLTTADLAALLHLSANTVKVMASRHPDRLPPRVGAMRSLRWHPETYRLWATGTLPAKPKVGRPRNP